MYQPRPKTTRIMKIKKIIAVATQRGITFGVILWGGGCEGGRSKWKESKKNFNFFFCQNQKSNNFFIQVLLLFLFVVFFSPQIAKSEKKKKNKKAREKRERSKIFEKEKKKREKDFVSLTCPYKTSIFSTTRKRFFANLFYSISLYPFWFYFSSSLFVRRIYLLMSYYSYYSYYYYYCYCCYYLLYRGYW